MVIIAAPVAQDGAGAITWKDTFTTILNQTQKEEVRDLR